MNQARQEQARVRAALARMVERARFVEANLPAVLARLTEAEGDGYPTGSGSGGRAGSSSADTSTTVEAGALRRIAGQRDPVTADLRRLRRKLDQAHDHLGWLEQDVATYVRARPTPDPTRCPKCGNETTDRLRRAMCTACYRRWERAGKPPTLEVEA